MFVASEEATSGSVIANGERISAFSSGCSQRLFCSGVIPALRLAYGQYWFVRHILNVYHCPA